MDRDMYPTLLLILEGAVDDGISELSSILTPAECDDLYRRMREALSHNPMTGEELGVDDILAILGHDLWSL